MSLGLLLLEGGFCVEYRDFVKTIEVDQINLSSLHVEKNEEFASELKDISVAMDFGEKDHYVKQGKLHVLSGLAVIALSSKIEIKEGKMLSEEEIDSKEILFKIEVVFDLSYNFKDIEDPDEFVQKNQQHVENFCEKNVPVNAWPYFREIINSSTVRMGVPPLTIQALKRV